MLFSTALMNINSFKFSLIGYRSIPSHISISPLSVLFVYTMFNFMFGTGKTEIIEIWTTKIDGPNFIRTNFIRTKSKILRSINGA